MVVEGQRLTGSRMQMVASICSLPARFGATQVPKVQQQRQHQRQRRQPGVLLLLLLLLLLIALEAHSERLPVMSSYVALLGSSE
jgi:hypothetical protein